MVAVSLKFGHTSENVEKKITSLILIAFLVMFPWLTRRVLLILQYLQYLKKSYFN